MTYDTPGKQPEGFYTPDYVIDFWKHQERLCALCSACGRDTGCASDCAPVLTRPERR